MPPNTSQASIASSAIGSASTKSSFPDQFRYTKVKKVYLKVVIDAIHYHHVGGFYIPVKYTTTVGMLESSTDLPQDENLVLEVQFPRGNQLIEASSLNQLHHHIWLRTISDSEVVYGHDVGMQRKFS